MLRKQTSVHYKPRKHFYQGDKPHTYSHAFPVGLLSVHKKTTSLMMKMNEFIKNTGMYNR